MKRATKHLISTALLAALSLPAAFAQSGEEGPKTIWDGVYSQTQAERGRNTYLATCARCHGDDLAGFRGAMDGKRFMEGWSEDTVHSLFHRIQTTMPPGQAGSISDQSYVDIVAFFLSRNKFPTGDEDLPVTGLENIRIQEKTGPMPVPSFAMVQVIGCLVQESTDAYKLISATEAVRVRDPGESTGEALEAAKAVSLGEATYDLLRNVVYLDPQNLIGHKVEAKGFLIRNDAGDRINVSTLKPLSHSCGK
jgi:mono/diheme cytochrome c family protein